MFKILNPLLSGEIVKYSICVIIINSCLPSDMAHFLSQLLSLFLLYIIDFMVFHKSLCLADNLAKIECQNSFRLRLYILVIDGLIERVDETMQIALHCYSFGSVL